MDDYDFELLNCTGNRIFDEILGECLQEQLATVQNRCKLGEKSTTITKKPERQQILKNPNGKIIF
jgi:hypothetical protein